MSRKLYPSFVLVLLLILCASFTKNDTNYPSEKGILYYTNQFRKAHHLPALKEIKYIDQLAYKHSLKMANGQVGFGHRGFGKRTATLKKHFGMIATGENVAYGKLTAKQVVKTWINSPPHRKNLLGNFNFIGIGVAKSPNGILFFTQVFVKTYKNIH